MLAALVAAICVVISVSFALYDTDMWQHLAVGRAIWKLHAFPTRQLWTWPTYGAPDVNASWGFRLLIWPIWHAFGVSGVFAWRWITTLAAFGLLWAAARKMGARGLAPLLVIVLASLVYRQRSQVRPETLVAVLLAAEIWILESWRARAPEGGAARDLRPWLVAIALAWANAHISYWLGLAVQGVYLVAGRGEARAPAARWLAHPALRGWRAPAAVLLASALASFINPWGWRALWQPFDYFLHWRHEPIFQSIGELAPINWRFNLLNGLPLLVAGWLVLMTWRARRFGLDPVEPLMFALFAAIAFPSQRFLGFFALVAVPFVARGLDAWVRMHSGRSGRAFSGGAGEPPALDPARGLWGRAALVALTCVAIGIPEWNRFTTPLGVRIDLRQSAPVAACDWIEAHGVRGRGFNPFAAGGYMVFRFWPDRSRLPFIDIHQAGTREDRYLYVYAMQDSSAWRVLDQKYRFDYVVIFTHQYPKDFLIDFLDADRGHWALVFSDDVAAIFVRRDGSLALLAPAEYRVLPAGRARLATLAACRSDTALRREFESEFERAEQGSPWNSRAKTLLAPLVLLDGRAAEARRLLDQAIGQNPLGLKSHAYRAQLELGSGQARAALRDFEYEIKLQGFEDGFLARSMGQTWARLGERDRARAWYARALARDPGDRVARDSLAALGAGAAR